MCGIFALLNGRTITPNIIENFQRGRGRGPENSTINIFLKNVIMGFHRLAINDLSDDGMQPFTDNNIHLICNGEIYNHKELKKNHILNVKFKSDFSIAISLLIAISPVPIISFFSLSIFLSQIIFPSSLSKYLIVPSNNVYKTPS